MYEHVRVVHAAASSVTAMLLVDVVTAPMVELALEAVSLIHVASISVSVFLVASPSASQNEERCVTAILLPLGSLAVAALLMLSKAVIFLSNATVVAIYFFVTAAELSIADDSVA